MQACTGTYAFEVNTQMFDRVLLLLHYRSQQSKFRNINGLKQRNSRTFNSHYRTAHLTHK